MNYERIEELRSAILTLDEHLDLVDKTWGIDDGIDSALLRFVEGKANETISQLQAIVGTPKPASEPCEQQVKSGDWIEILSDSDNNFAIGSVHECTSVDREGWPWMYCSAKDCPQCLRPHEYIIVAKPASVVEAKYPNSELPSEYLGRDLCQALGKHEDAKYIPSFDPSTPPAVDDWYRIDYVHSSLDIKEGGVYQVDQLDDDGYFWVATTVGDHQCVASSRIANGTVTKVPAP